jgi:hypothetical protein
MGKFSEGRFMVKMLTYNLFQARPVSFILLVKEGRGILAFRSYMQTLILRWHSPGRGSAIRGRQL